MSGPRRRTRGHPALAWSQLAWKTGEMMLASAQVIAHRTARMAAAGPMPDARDRAEFALMGQEKIEAAVESATAMASHSLSRSMAGTTRLWQDMMGVTLDLALLGTSRTPAQAWQRQARLIRRLAGSTTTQAQWAGSVVALSGKALAPVHRRTAANVKRLARGR